jgi:hypothetical protein
MAAFAKSWRRGSAASPTDDDVLSCGWLEGGGNGDELLAEA